MLTRDQVYTMLLIRNRENTIFSVLPNEVFGLILNMNNPPESDINIALRHAALATKEDIDTVIEMIKANPRLLLQASNVVTPGGVSVMRTTLYEFFLGEGDPDSAKQIEFGFAAIPNGDNERIRQYERYRPHIEALAKQVKLKQPAFDLKPLIDLIKESRPEDIQAALKEDMNHQSTLRNELIAFRNAVKPTGRTVGMHYKHYTTLIQALDLLYDKWEALSNNYTNYDKCDLIWRQIIGYLQRGLPSVDRFGFARAFDDAERSLVYKYDNGGSFPAISADDPSMGGLGFDEAIYGGKVGGPSAVWWATDGSFGNHMSSKNFKLGELMQQRTHQHSARCVIL
jgi:hypothetical protein